MGSSCSSSAHEEGDNKGRSPRQEKQPVSATTKVQVAWRELMVRYTMQEAGEVFYKHLFDLHPELHGQLFTRTNIIGQAAKLITMLDFAIENLHDLGTLEPQLVVLGRRHVRYGVRPEHYPCLGDALFATLRTGQEGRLCDEDKAAWAEVYTVVASAMKRGADDCDEPQQQGQQGQ